MPTFNLPELEKQLKTAEGFIENIELDCELIPAGEQFELPTLLVALPYDEEGNAVALMVNPVPLGEGDEHTHILQFYMELPLNLTHLSEEALLREVDTLNRSLPMGLCMTLPRRADSPYERMVGARHMYTYPRKADLDEDSFMEVLLLFILSLDVITEHFDNLGR